MAIFLESPWPILVVGIAVEAVLAMVLLRTGQGRMLWAMIGVAAFVLLGLVVERFVVTDREAVGDTLDTAAAAVETNNLDRLLDCVSPRAEKTRKDSRYVLGLLEFNKARICNLEVTVNRLTSPPTAKAKFQAIGQGHDRHGEIPYQGFARWVTVTMRKEGDRWLIGDYTVEDLPMP
jgi:hypothetical protein